MYAFPAADVVRVPAPTSGSAMVAHATRFQIAASPLQLQPTCPVFWVVPGTSPLVARLREQTEVRTTAVAGAEWQVTRGPLSVALADDVRLLLRPKRVAQDGSWRR
jgi:hypothetical protein